VGFFSDYALVIAALVFAVAFDRWRRRRYPKVRWPL
jgi:hypothetical protein